jgi:hypothetical protein
MARRFSRAEIAEMADKRGISVLSGSGERLSVSEWSKRGPRSPAPRRTGDGRAQAYVAELIEYAFPNERVVREYALPTTSSDGKSHTRRIDVAIPAHHIAVESDGWRFHARYPAAFATHTARQNEITLAGWHLLRYTRAMSADAERIVTDLLRAIIEVSWVCPAARLPGHCAICNRETPRWLTAKGQMLAPDNAAFANSHGEMTGTCACSAPLSDAWSPGWPPAH